MKKFLSLILATIMTAAVCSCDYSVKISDSGIESADGNNEASKAIAKNSTTKFMDAACEFDVVTMSDFCNVDLVSRLEYESLKVLANMFFEKAVSSNETLKAVDEEAGDVIRETMDDIIDSVIEANSWEFTGEERYDEATGKWVFGVDVSFINAESVYEEILNESEELIDELITKYSEDLVRITLAEDKKQAAAELATKIISETDYKAIITEACKNASSTTITGEIYVQSAPGGWVVDVTGETADKIIQLLKIAIA